MPLAESLALFAGPPIAKALLNIWTKRAKTGRTARRHIDTLLAELTDNPLARRQGATNLAFAGDRIAETISLESDDSGLSDDAQRLIANVIADSIDAASITDEVLSDTTFDVDVLAEMILLETRKRTDGLDHNHIDLVDKLSREAATAIIDVVIEWPTFSSNVLLDVLKTNAIIQESVNNVLEQLVLLRSDIANLSGDHLASQFEYNNRQVVSRKLDQLILFGVDAINPSIRRQRLTTAFVSLAVIHGREEEDDLEQDQYTDGNSEVEVDTNGLLERSGRLVLLGQAGSGKTTILKWIAVNAARDEFPEGTRHWNNKLPFFIPLRDYADRDLPPPQDFPAYVATNTVAGSMPQGWVHQQLQSGRAIVLVDSVDEVTEEQRPRVRAWLSDLIDVYPSAHYVLTARNYAIDKPWLLSLQNDYDFVVARIQDMGMADIEAFVPKWHHAVSEDASEDVKEDAQSRANQLIDLISSNSNLRSLAGTPLLCAVICALNYDPGQKVPSARSELYDACVSMLLRRRAAAQDLLVETIEYPNLPEETYRIILRDLAHWMLMIGRNEVEVERVLDKIDQSLPQVLADSSTVKSSRILAFYLERSGLLREPVTGVIEFSHRSFQDFLAAESALYQDQHEMLLEKAVEVRWREVVVMAVGSKIAKKSDRLNIIAGLIELGDKDPSERQSLHLLAVACLESSPALSPELRAIVQQRLRQLIPPTNLTEAGQIASAKELALPYLTKTSGMNGQKAAASVRALGLIAKDETLNEQVIQSLSSYSSDSRQAVIAELIKAREYFDPLQYRQHVMSKMKIHHYALRMNEATGSLAAFDRLGFLLIRDRNITDALINDVNQIGNLQQLGIYGAFIGDYACLANLQNTKRLDLMHVNVAATSTQIVKNQSVQQLVLEGDLESLGSVLPLFACLNELTLTTLSRRVWREMPDSYRATYHDSYYSYMGFTSGRRIDLKLLSDVTDHLTRMSLVGRVEGDSWRYVRSKSNLTALRLYDPGVDPRKILEVDQLIGLSWSEYEPPKDGGNIVDVVAESKLRVLALDQRVTTRIAKRLVQNQSLRVITMQRYLAASAREVFRKAGFARVRSSGSYNFITYSRGNLDDETQSISRWTIPKHR